MKIPFSKQEFRVLIDLLEMADWVLHAHRSDREDTQRYHSLIQKLFAQAKDNGCGEYIQHIPSDGSYCVTRTYEEQSETMQFIDQFEEDSFWEELITKLSERDAERRVAPKRLGDLGLEQLFNQLGIEEERWAQEFENHGVARLQVAEP